MIEVKFQKVIIDILKSEGSFGYKLSNRFSVGVSDLLLRIDDKLVLCECKRVVTPRYDSPLLNNDIGIQPNQSKFLRDFRVGIILVLTETPDGDKVRVTLLPKEAVKITRTKHEIPFKPRTNKLERSLTQTIREFCNENGVFA